MTPAAWLAATVEGTGDPLSIFETELRSLLCVAWNSHGKPTRLQYLTALWELNERSTVVRRVGFIRRGEGILGVRGVTPDQAYTLAALAGRALGVCDGNDVSFLDEIVPALGSEWRRMQERLEAAR